MGGEDSGKSNESSANDCNLSATSVKEGLPRRGTGNEVQTELSDELEFVGAYCTSAWLASTDFIDKRDVVIEVFSEDHTVEQENNSLVLVQDEEEDEVAATLVNTTNEHTISSEIQEGDHTVC